MTSCPTMRPSPTHGRTEDHIYLAQLLEQLDELGEGMKETALLVHAEGLEPRGSRGDPRRRRIHHFLAGPRHSQAHEQARSPDQRWRMKARSFESQLRQAVPPAPDMDARLRARRAALAEFAKVNGEQGAAAERAAANGERRRGRGVCRGCRGACVGTQRPRLRAARRRTPAAVRPRLAAGANRSGRWAGR